MDLERENELLKSIIDLRKQADYWKAMWEKENSLVSRYRQLVFTTIEYAMPREFIGGDFSRGQWNALSWWVYQAKRLLPDIEDPEAHRFYAEITERQKFIKESIQREESIKNLPKRERTIARRKMMSGS